MHTHTHIYTHKYIQTHTHTHKHSQQSQRDREVPSRDCKTSVCYAVELPGLPGKMDAKKALALGVPKVIGSVYARACVYVCECIHM